SERILTQRNGGTEKKTFFSVSLFLCVEIRFLRRLSPRSLRQLCLRSLRRPPSPFSPSPPSISGQLSSSASQSRTPRGPSGDRNGPPASNGRGRGRGSRARTP